MSATVTELEQAVADVLTEKAMAQLDKLAEAWAERVGLTEIAQRIVGNVEAVEALLRQSYMEGAYEGHMAAVDAAAVQGGAR